MGVALRADHRQHPLGRDRAALQRTGAHHAHRWDVALAREDGQVETQFDGELPRAGGVIPAILRQTMATAGRTGDNPVR